MGREVQTTSVVGKCRRRAGINTVEDGRKCGLGAKPDGFRRCGNGVGIGTKTRYRMNRKDWAMPRSPHSQSLERRGRHRSPRDTWSSSTGSSEIS
jgi:hypothetical protein